VFPSGTLDDRNDKRNKHPGKDWAGGIYSYHVGQNPEHDQAAY
jgi:hypothetical protein